MSKKVNYGFIVLTLAWVVIFLSPLMFINYAHGFNLRRFLIELVIPISLCIVFFTNFIYLAPKVLMKGHSGKFLLSNALIIVGIAMVMHEWVIFSSNTWYMELHDKVTWHPTYNENWTIFYLCRDIFNMSVSATVATAIVLSRNWTIMANQKTALEKERMEMEVSMLKYQMNPHFLLNSLNNIYALTTLNQQLAQRAIQELSDIFRHVLYDSELETVLLSDETKFIKSYVELMSIRTSNDLTISQDIDIQQVPQARIAPLLIIPLIENAFKHGISATHKCFINISIKAQEDCILCHIANSNHPKNKADFSGSGIGLQQVQRRLDLSYPNQYEWTYGPSDDNLTFNSKIKLYDTKLYHH